MENTVAPNKFRLGVFIVLLAAVLSQAGYALFKPASDKEKDVATLDYPQEAPLPGWQQVKTLPLEPQAKNQLYGQEYQYKKDGQNLTFQARYYPQVGFNTSYGLIVHKIVPPASIVPEIKQDPKRGYYAFFEAENKVYLTACLNARGDSTVSQAQSVRNRYANGWTVPSVLGWLALGTDFADSRCLWTVAFVPNGSETLTPEAQKTLLETAWLDWRDWWKPKLNQELQTVWIKGKF